MIRFWCTTILAMLSLLQSPSTMAVEADNEDLASALFNGTPQVHVRYRFELVNDDRFIKDAEASTARLRLNYTTRTWRNWTAFGEFDYIGEVFINDFNSGAGTSSPDRDQYPVVADPKGADLNQLTMDYGGIKNTQLRIGRQRILLHDQRFVGGVGWRQNEQTYDGVSVHRSISERSHASYSYLTSVKRIFGNRTTAGRHDADTHLLNASLDLTDNWKLSPFYYHIDNDDVPALSTATGGLRLGGSVKLGTSSLNLLGSIAKQTDVANNPTDFDASYYHVSANIDFDNSISVGLGLEVLEGDQLSPGTAFRTPLATLHLFNGWADQFLATPDAGIEDLYLSVKYQHQKWRWQGVYHDFSAESGSADWGTELDLSFGRNISNNIALLLKGAFFTADDPGRADVRKIWVQFVANY
ncbi:MAG: alginate export family protein [Woeseia sp.]|nr:alginate export family protein [Woeseia sp.]